MTAVAGGGFVVYDDETEDDEDDGELVDVAEMERQMLLDIRQAEAAVAAAADASATATLTRAGALAASDTFVVGGTAGDRSGAASSSGRSAAAGVAVAAGRARRLSASSSGSQLSQQPPSVRRVPVRPSGVGVGAAAGAGRTGGVVVPEGKVLCSYKASGENFVEQHW